MLLKKKFVFDFYVLYRYIKHFYSLKLNILLSGTNEGSRCCLSLMAELKKNAVGLKSCAKTRLLLLVLEHPKRL